MSAEVAQGARSGGLPLKAPVHGGVRVGEGLLEVSPAEVAYLTEFAGGDDLLGQANGGHKTVVEGAHVLDASPFRTSPDLVALVGVTSQGLLTEHMLAALSGRDARFRMH